MNCKCTTLTKNQQIFLAKLIELGIEACLGGKYTISYRILSGDCRDNFNNDMTEIFGTADFSELKACQYDAALDFISNWFPDDDIMEMSVEMEDSFTEFRYRYVEEMPQDCPAYQQLMEDFIYAVCSGTERPCEG